MLLDIPFLAKMSEQLGHRLAELEQELFKLVGHEFNLRSTQQLSQVLFDEMDFPAKGLKRTASGHYSTAVSTLEQLAASSDEMDDRQVRVLEIIFEQRQLEKLRGTYVGARAGQRQTDACIPFSQRASTGRISSSDPSLQNIPIRTEIGRQIRQRLCSAAGLGADLRRLQPGGLRVLAHVVKRGADQSFRADKTFTPLPPRDIQHAHRPGRPQPAAWRRPSFATIWRQRVRPQPPHQNEPRRSPSVPRPILRDLPAHPQYIASTIARPQKKAMSRRCSDASAISPNDNRRLPYNNGKPSARRHPRYQGGCGHP